MQRWHESNTLDYTIEYSTIRGAAKPEAVLVQCKV